MLETVLVADRGAVGAVVVGAVQAMGARAVTVHLDGEKGLGDESVLLGGPGSDLDVVKLVEAARQCGADAVHPGAGPLAAHAGFARAVVDAGLVWVGPPPEDLHAGSPLQLRRTEVQLIDGAVVDVRQVRGDVIASTGPGAAGSAAARGVVTLIGDVVVPHLTLGAVVTAEAVGIDLADLQLRTAAGEDVPFELAPRTAVGVVLRGSGRVAGLTWPGGVTAVAACREGRDVPYDGVVALLVAAAPDLREAAVALQAALREVVVDGVQLEVPLGDLSGQAAELVEEMT